MTSNKAAKSKRPIRRSGLISLASLSSVISQNLANMATVFASSGSVLLCLLLAKRFG